MQRRPVRGGRRHRIVEWVLAVLLGLAIAAYAVRWLDVAREWVAVLQSLAPVAGIAVVVLTLLAMALRRKRIALVGMAASVIVLVIAVGFVWPGRAAPERPGDLVVMSANLEFGEADAASLVAAATSVHADVLVLVELTPEGADRLRAAGLDALLPYAVGTPLPGADGSVIRSRHPLTARDAPKLPGETAFLQPAADLALPDGRTVIVRAVHPFPPTDPNLEFWRSGLAGLRAWTQRQPDGIPLVLAGDFNASADHPGFRALAEGMVDAHAQTGSGWVRTWPQGRRIIRPFVQIDHVLARGLQAVAAGVVTVPGTDHAAVWARWSLG